MLKSDPKFIILIILGLFTLFYALFLNPHGHFSIDEGVYHLMSRSFSDAKSLEVWNGYEEFPSSELTLSNIRTYKNHLTPQYPYLFPVMTYPFYKIAGYHGLFILNAIAFIGVVILCFVLARKLFNDQQIAFNACFIFILSTYAWEYSQAAWPHATSMLFTTGAVYLTFLAIHAKNNKSSLAIAFLAGLVTGFGAGVRLDVIFIFPVITVPYLITRPWRPWQTFASCVGSVPGLIILSLTNHTKFGLASPFSYGNIGTGNISGIKPYIPLVAASVTVFLVILIFRGINLRSMQPPIKYSIGIFTVALGLSFILLPWNVVSRLGDGLYQLVIDLRIRDLDILESGLTRSSDGAMVYLNMGLKKSLLQSCPYLVCLIVPLESMLRKRTQYLSMGILYLASVAFIAPFSYFAWHGGLCFNMRFFLPALPFTSILTAYALKELTCDLRLKRRYIGTLIAFLTYIAFCLFILIPPLSIHAEETIYLTLPLVIAMALLLLLLPQIVTRGRNHLYLRGVSSTILIMALVWSGLVGFSYDFSRSSALRATYLNISQTASKIISSDSILFTDSPDAFLGLFEKDHIRIAVPSNDNFKDFRGLIEYHLKAKHHVYASFSPDMWEKIHKAGLLNELKKTLKLKHKFGILNQISRETMHNTGSESSAPHVMDSIEKNVSNHI